VSDAELREEPNALIENISKAVESHTKLGGQILGSVIGLRTLVDDSNLTPKNVADGVASDAEQKKFVPPEMLSSLAARVADLLEAPAVMVASKAYSLVVADASPFRSVRIVSDVRPIFLGKDEGLHFSGSVIIHHLQVDVSEGDDQHSALTTADLLKLKRAVERALEKDRKLRDVLRSGPLSPLNPSGAE
jgi:hypothetical protein